VGWFRNKEEQWPDLSPLETVVVRIAGCKCADWQHDCECDIYYVDLHSIDPTPDLVPKLPGAVKRTLVWIYLRDERTVTLSKVGGGLLGVAGVSKSRRDEWTKVLGSKMRYQAYLHVGREESDEDDEPVYQCTLRINPAGRDRVLSLEEAS
jgi:hypothetical protein